MCKPEKERRMGEGRREREKGEEGLRGREEEKDPADKTID